MPKTLKRGDTWPPITGKVSDDDGPVPLGTASEVLLLLRASGNGPDGADTLIEAVVEVVAPAAVAGEPQAGMWTYTWQPGDTDIAGEYRAEIQVTWRPGVVETFPNDDDANETVTIDPDLNPDE